MGLGDGLDSAGGGLRPDHYRFNASVASPHSSDPEFSSEAFLHQLLQQPIPFTDLEREELRSLAAERDAALFSESLLAIGRRLENADRLAEASGIYSSMSQAGLPQRVVSQAQSRLDAINGVGDSSPRAEFLMRRLARHAIDPSMIVGMGAAGMAFRTVRLAMLSRLAATPVPSPFTRGLGANLVASSVGFLAEAPIFTAAVRGTNVLLGRELDWSPGAVWTEFAGGAITLFCLKGMGALAGTLLRRLNGGMAPAQLSVPRRVAAKTIQQGGIFAGILTGHKLEEILEFREAHDGATFLTDGLATLLQFHVAGRLSHQLMGERFRQTEQAINLQSEALQRALESRTRTRVHDPSPAPVGAPPHLTRTGGVRWGPPARGEGNLLGDTLLVPTPAMSPVPSPLAGEGGRRPGEGSWGRLRRFARHVALAPFWMMMGAHGEGNGGIGGEKPREPGDTEPMNPSLDQVSDEVPTLLEATPRDTARTLPMANAPEPVRRTNQIYPPIIRPPSSSPQYRRRPAIDDATLARLEAFPRTVQGAHEQSGEANTVFFGLNSLKWWLGMIRRDAGELGAEALVHSGRILFGRFQEEAGRQDAVAKQLQHIAAAAQIRMEVEPPTTTDWWRPLWERGLEDSAASSETLGALLREVQLEDAALAEHWLLELAQRDFERSEIVREAMERGTVRITPTGRFQGLREAMAAGNEVGANELIAEAYRQAWLRPNLQEVVSEIRGIREAAREAGAERAAEVLTPPPAMTGDSIQDFRGWMEYVNQTLQRELPTFPPEAQLCLLLAQERIARATGGSVQTHADALLVRAHRLNSTLNNPLPAEQMEVMSLHSILNHFGFYPPNLHHAFYDIQELVRADRVPEALASLTRLQGDIGHLTFALARLVRTTNEVGKLSRLFPVPPPPAAQSVSFAEAVAHHLERIHLEIGRRYSNLSEQQRFDELTELRLISREMRGQSTGIAAIDAWAKALLKQLPDLSGRMRLNQPFQTEPRLMQAFDGVKRLAELGRWSEAFEKIGEFREPSSQILLLHLLVNSAKQAVQPLPLIQVSQVPQIFSLFGAEQFQASLVATARQIGEGIKLPMGNFGPGPAHAWSHLAWILRRMGQGEQAEQFYREAENALRERINPNDQAMLEARGRAHELINRQRGGTWAVDPQAVMETVAQAVASGNWYEALQLAIDARGHHQVIALAYITESFLQAASLLHAANQIPRAMPALPVAVTARHHFESLPVRDLESIPEEHRHLIPQLRPDHVLFPRFRRIRDELASLVQAPDRIAIRLFGPAGTGKTTLPEMIAGRMRVPLLRFPISKRTDPSDFDGSWRLEQVNGELVPVFEEGVTTVAMERGYHLVLDEPDLGRPGVLAYINNVSAPGRTAWVRRRDGRLAQIEVNQGFRVWVTENGMRELGREEHGRDFLRRFVPYHVGTWTQEEVTTVLAERYESQGGRERWDRRTSEMLAMFHTQAQRLAQGMRDPQTQQVMPPLGSGVGQRVEFTPRSVLRLAQRLVTQGPLTPESLSRAIRSEYILPLAESADRELMWNQARAVFGPLVRARGWAADVIGPQAIPAPTLESISQRFLNGRTIPETGFVWTSQALRVAEEILWNRELGFDVMLLGDAGEGKTELPRQIAALLGVEYFQKTMSSETDEEDLVGGPGRGPNGEVSFVPDIVTLATERGGILHLDEYLLADTGRLESVMNPLMDDARAVFLKNPYRRIPRRSDPELTVVLTSNPPWEFQDRHEHSAAAMSRVAVIYLSGEFGMQPGDRLQILRRWAGSTVVPPGAANKAFGERGGSQSDSEGRHGHHAPREDVSPPNGPEGTAIQPQGRRARLSFRVPGLIQKRADEINRHGTVRNLTTWRATHRPESARAVEERKVVDLDPQISERFVLPHQLVFDLREGRLLEIAEDGSFVPLRPPTVQGIQRLATRLTRQTQVEMGLATNRVFRILYGLMSGHQTDLAGQTIRLDIADMLRRPYLAALGIGKHEWAHATIDRPSERYDAHEPGRLLANVIGDPRMNEYFASLREDFREQMEVMAESCWPERPAAEELEMLRSKLPHEQFASGVIYAWRQGRVPDWIENPRVREALEQALPILRPAFTLFPESTQDRHVDAAAAEFYRIVDQVWPIYETLLPESVQELVKRLEAGESPEQLMNPFIVVLRLPQEPSAADGRPPENVGAGLVSAPAEVEAAPSVEPPAETGRDGEIRQPSEQASTAPQSTEAAGAVREPPLQDLAWQILNHRAGRLADQFESQDPQHAERRRQEIAMAQSRLAPPPEPIPLTPQERQQVQEAQQQALQQDVESDLFRRLVPPGAIQAAQRLRRILPPENPTYLEGHFTTGKRIDRRRAVQDTLAPIPSGRVMLRRLRPGERDAQLVILSDVSPSMVDAGAVENSLKASAAAVYLCEQLGMDYGEILFSSEPMVAKPLGGPLRTYARKNELLNQKQEAFQRGSDTNIRDPLRMAIDWIKERPARTNAIILVTDGAEGWRHQTTKTLPELEAEAEAERIHVMVLAMGAAQRSVPQNFKHYRFSSADGSEIPDQIVELIEEAHQRRFRH